MYAQLKKSRILKTDLTVLISFQTQSTLAEKSISIFRQKSEEESISTVITELKVHKRYNRPIRILSDYNPICKRGGPEKFSEPGWKTCRVKVQTLKDGVLDAPIRDFRCNLCGTEEAFDGFESGLFCASKHWNIFRDVHDVLLYNAACLGLTYESFRQMLQTISGTAQNKASDWLRRRNTNTIFSLFLKTIDFVQRPGLRDLFRCWSCERDHGKVNTRLKAVVVDGTAVGILDELLVFLTQT